MYSQQGDWRKASGHEVSWAGMGEDMGKNFLEKTHRYSQDQANRRNFSENVMGHQNGEKLYDSDHNLTKGKAWDLAVYVSYFEGLGPVNKGKNFSHDQKNGNKSIEHLWGLDV